MKYRKDLKILFKDNKFDKYDEIVFWKIIKPIFRHPEFQKRLDNTIYPHHGTTSLGDHILNDAIVSYKIAKAKLEKNIKVNLKLVVLVAMFHDLYELPWQNSPIKKDKFINKHGFIHPIEATINAITWFPEYFKNEDEAILLIDGIIHHMYPFPVRSIDKTFFDIELNNPDKVNKIPANLQEIIINSSCRNKILHVSYSKSKFKEGRIISKADKIVSFKKEFSTLNDYKASVTGKNPDLN